MVEENELFENVLFIVITHTHTHVNNVFKLEPIQAP